MDKNLRKIKLKIHGMHCSSCEVLIERKLKQIPGVHKIVVHHADGKAELLCSSLPKIEELREKIKKDGYTISFWDEYPRKTPAHRNGAEDYIEIGMIFFILLGLYLLFSGLKVIPEIGISPGMSYGFVFLVGLVAAASSCIAVTGGLLLSAAGKYNEANPDLSGIQKFKPHLFFNAGRIVSYTALGGLVGYLGSAFSLSPKTTGFVTVAASAVMIIFGLQMLKFFPWLRRFEPRMPKFLAHKIHEASASRSRAAPFLLGASTFFLPCGFTQALQLYVLSTGSFAMGAFTMLAFSLGTLPALLSISALSSFSKGNLGRLFLRFSAVLVIFLGVTNINRGLNLTGMDFGFDLGIGNNQIAKAENQVAQMVNGVQVVKMKASGYDYSPRHFTVTQGIPVEWQIDGRKAAGCVQVIIAEGLGITEYLPEDKVKTIRFTPKESGVFDFNCPMGMATPGSFTVMPNNSGIVGESPTSEIQDEDEKSDAQKLYMEVTRENGFYPNSFTVKKDFPVELTVDSKVRLGGCMSVLMVPEYDAVVNLALGRNKLVFTPLIAGKVYATCSMGTKLAQFNVIN